MMTATTKVLIVLMFTLLEKKRTSQLTKLLFRYRKQQSISECQVTHSHFEWSLSLTSSDTSIRNCCQLTIDVVFTLSSSAQNQLRSWLQSTGSKNVHFDLLRLPWFSDSGQFIGSSLTRPYLVRNQLPSKC